MSEASEAPLPSSAVVGAFDRGDDRQAQVVAGGPRCRSRTFFCRSAKKDWRRCLRIDRLIVKIIYVAMDRDRYLALRVLRRSSRRSRSS